MKKVIALLAVCGFALAFVACGKKAEEASNADSTAAPVETPVATPDSTATGDSTVAGDSTAH